MAYNKETGMYEGFIYKIWNDVNDKLYIGQAKTTIRDRWHGHMSSALCDTRSHSALYNAMRCYGRDKFHIEEISKIQCNTYEQLCEALDELEKKKILEYNSHIIYGNGYNIEFGGTGQNKKVPGQRVCKYDNDLNLLDTYISLQEAGRANDIDGATIWAVCNHHYYRAGGFVWAYENELPIKPPSYQEIRNKMNETREKNKRNKPKAEKPKTPKKYKRRALEPSEKRKRRLDRLGWNGQRIIQYNAFGEVINIFEDMIDAIELIPIKATELKKNLSGENKKFGKTVLRYENIPFDYYPRSADLQPVVLYDLQGNYIDRFESHGDAEKYLGVPRGELAKVLKRGGSVKKHLVAPYGEEIVRKIDRIEKTYEMLSDDFSVLKEFDSSREISAMFGVVDCHNQIRKAILNNTKYKGYYWRYKEEFPISI